MQTLQMNEKRWSIASDLASDLIDHDADLNEFGKVTAFMRRYQKADNAKDQFMLLLQRLANSNNAPIRSKSTPKYYQDIKQSCEKHLKDISDTGELMLILGWCMRLMRYYKVEPKRAAEAQRRPQEPRQTPEPRSAQRQQLPKAPEKPKVKVGQKVNATILKKEGSQVTVQLQTDENEELVFERPYYPGLVGAKVKLRVTGIDAIGKINKVIP